MPQDQFRGCFVSAKHLDQQNPDSKFLGEQFEIGSIRGYDRGPISARRKSDQRIILEFLPLASIPIPGISDLLDNHSSFPPIRSSRSPLDLGQPPQILYQAPRLRRSGSPAKFGQYN